jgi:hypothetical protein
MKAVALMGIATHGPLTMRSLVLSAIGLVIILIAFKIYNHYR